MKKRALVFLFVIIAAIVLSAFAFADTYKPNNDGLYTITLDAEGNAEYILIVLKGKYDQTNFVEAYNSAQDADILYFEQKALAEGQDLVFGPFAPYGYFDATLIMSGSSMTGPEIVGYLSADGILNCKTIDISGLKNSYIVEGYTASELVEEDDAEEFIKSKDIKAKAVATPYDSFGYASPIKEDVEFSLIGNDENVSIDEKTGELVIGSRAKEQTVGVVAKTSEAQSIFYIDIKRKESVFSEILVYTEPACKTPVTEVSVIGTTGNYPSVTFYVKTLDQYGDFISDSYYYLYNGKTSTNTVRPTHETTADMAPIYFTATSASYGQKTSVKVIANKRPDYKSYALDLYNLIGECKKELEKLGSEKFESAENGRDIFPEDLWISASVKNVFVNAIAVAENALKKYGQAGFGDNDYLDEYNALANSKNSYNISFKNGIRKDLTALSFTESFKKVYAGGNFTELKYTTEPYIGETTDKLTFTSSDPGIVIVDDKGYAKGIGNGKATITVKNRGTLISTMEVESYLRITSVQSPATSVQAVYGHPEKTTFTVMAYPENHGDKLMWSFDTPDVAELVVNGNIATVIPKGVGTTTVSFYGEGGGVDYPKKVKITVTKPAWETCALPVVSVKGGIVEVGTKVTLTTATEGADIYYTLDGTVPSSTNGRLYTSPIAITQDLTLKAITTYKTQKNVDDEGNVSYFGKFDSGVVSYDFVAVDTGVSVDDAYVKPGKNVKLGLTLTDIIDIQSASVEVAYNAAAFTFTGIENIASNVTASANVQDGVVTIELSFANDFDGKALELCFDAAENAEQKDYAFDVARADAVTAGGQIKHAKTKGGIVTVNDYLMGDANGDGMVSLEDILLIKLYVSGSSVAEYRINLLAADVNNDGVVNKADANLITQYCVGLITSFN